MKMAELSVRARLIFWYVGVLTFIVCLFSVGILYVVKVRFYDELDLQLGR